MHCVLASRFPGTSLGSAPIQVTGKVIVDEKHCTEVMLTPEGKSYRLSGESNLLEDARSDGAGGPVQTDRRISFTLRVAA